MFTETQGMANLPFTYDELQAAVLDKRVTKRDHPSLPMSIYNYSDEVQYTRQWDDITRNCRGLIIDHDGNIVARPWQKFFNLGEVNLGFQFDDPVEVMDKVDGSLGILYPQNTIWSSAHHTYGIATRGSFSSNQAAYASGHIWDEKYTGLHPVKGYTMLFEIIYPSNRIVLDYDGMKDLVLLGAVENETGYYISPNHAKYLWFTYIAGRYMETVWAGPVVDVYEYNSIGGAIEHMGRENKEGYVIRRGNFMVKLKEPDYLDLHRLVTNLSSKTIWDKLKDGKTEREIISAFPDEFHKDVQALLDPLLDAFYKRLVEINAGFHATIDSYMSDGVPFDRGAYARSIAKAKDKGYYFTLLDNKSIAESLWNELRPKAENYELRPAAEAD